MMIIAIPVHLLMHDYILLVGLGHWLILYCMRSGVGSC